MHPYAILNSDTEIKPHYNSAVEMAGLAISFTGLLCTFVIAFFGLIGGPWISLLLSAGLISGGALLYIFGQARGMKPGIHNDGITFSAMQFRGWTGWITAILFTGFYIIIYWFGDWLHNLVAMVEPMSQAIRNAPADHWFLYGLLYTLAILVMGVKFMYKYQHSRYHLIRTATLMFFQLGFAFLLPAILMFFKEPEFYFSYFWPLQFNYLFPNDVHSLVSDPGALGTFMVFWGAVMSFIATPVLTYFYGKRWYCSWVCGCGGLAETFGDPYRHLSDKRLIAWKFERWIVYGVLAIITFTTMLLWASLTLEIGWLSSISGDLAEWYGFYIGAIFAGVIGVGFYPLMGSRVWCRFGCPMAAILGIIQRFYSRFRITTNGGQCISCGNCSAFCEMGIDVRWYAQRQQNIVRASCVGCGICASVCPRGVLKLENGPSDINRAAIQVRKNGIEVAE
ncbi:MAG: 4Fe-4S dicluster-binding protein [Bacteroidia bacterium]